MRIGLLSGEFPPMEGGVGAYTQELGRALHALGHDLHIITHRDGASLDLETGRRMSQPQKLDFGTLHATVRRWNFASLATVTDITLRNELEIVNIQYQAAAYDMRNPAINILPWRLKGPTKTIVTFHDLRVPFLFPKVGRLRRKAVNFMADQAGGVITTNPEDLESIRATTKVPSVHIPIGTNIAPYLPNHIELAEARQLLGLGKDDFLLGYFGFLNASKGADLLIDALVSLPKRFHIVFIGGQLGASDQSNIPFLEDIKQKISRGNLTSRVHWTGFLPDHRVSTLLCAADLLVMPYVDGASLRRGTLMAALAHGRPLLTTMPASPTAELVHGTNTWLVPPSDSAALSSAILILAGDPDLRAALGAGAKEIANLFSWDKIARQAVEFYQSIIAS